MRSTRRQWLCAVGASVAAFCVRPALAAHKPVVPERSTWSREQLEGRAKLDRYLRRVGVPLARREQAFEGLVVAAREGKRERALLSRAATWCREEYGDFDWDKLLKLLQFVGAILSILMLFI